MSEESLILREVASALAEMERMDNVMTEIYRQERKRDISDQILDSLGTLGSIAKTVKRLESFSDLLKVSGVMMLISILNRIVEPIEDAFDDIEDDLFAPLEDIGHAIATLVYDYGDLLVTDVHSWLVPLVQDIVGWIQTDGRDFIQALITEHIPNAVDILVTILEWFQEEGMDMLNDIKDVSAWILDIKNKIDAGREPVEMPGPEDHPFPFARLAQ